MGEKHNLPPSVAEVKKLRSETRKHHIEEKRVTRYVTNKCTKQSAKEHLWRTRPILKTYLSPRNKIKAINQRAIPVFQYSCRIINWPQSEINKLDIKIRKLLTIHKMFPKNQCIPRMHLPSQQGVRSLMELNQVHRMTTVLLFQHMAAWLPGSYHFFKAQLCPSTTTLVLILPTSEG